MKAQSKTKLKYFGEGCLVFGLLCLPILLVSSWIVWIIFSLIFATGYGAVKHGLKSAGDYIKQKS